MRWPAVLVVVAAGIGALPACDTAGAGPFGGLPLDGDFAADVTQPVHVARDRDGIAHIRAKFLADAAYAQGYVMAHDRLPQMDVLRHLATGTLAELYGAVDPSVIDGDLVRRMFRLRAIATDSWATLQASSDPTDLALVTWLTRFSDGVNAYARALRRADWTLDPAIATSFEPGLMADWTPVDSLAIARWWSIAQSFTVPFELDATRLYQQLRTFYDASTDDNPAALVRHGISRDLWRLAPIGSVATVDGFPDAAPATPTSPILQPTVPPALLTAARDFFAHDTAFRVPNLGGYAFATAARDGAGPVLAAAEDLSLTNPALFYPTHVVVAQDAPDDSGVLGDDDAPVGDVPFDIVGATLPGVPGVMIGANHDVAWAATASLHDVNDVYLEPADVSTDDDEEVIQIGTLGQIIDRVTVHYARVPDHGPIIPAIDPATHTLVPRPAGPALSIRSIFDPPTPPMQPIGELRALAALPYATSVDDGLQALADTHTGWTLIDRDQHIAWTASADIPVRAASADAWDPLLEQDALSPFFVLPGTGEAEWTLSTTEPPRAIDPATGYLVAANADPIGATLDGKPLNQTTAAGTPFYAGVDYDTGLRQDRIATLISTPHALGIDAIAAFQFDTHSSIGERFTPMLLTALGRLDRQPIGPADVNPYLDALPAADLARLAAARGLLQSWTFATPASGGSDSAATALFQTWLHFFVERSIQDELEAIGFDVWQLDDNAILRVIYAMLHDPNSFVTSPASQQPILCDNYAVSGPDDSCTKGILQAMVDAMTFLETSAAASPGDPDPTHWQWGGLHQIALAPWPGAPDTLRIPADGSRLPRPGDASSLDRGNPGWADLDFAGHPRGSAFRLTAQVITDAPLDGSAFDVRATLAGGTIFDPRSPHSRDQLDRGYLTGQALPVAISVEQITAAGETRWVFH